VIFTGWMSLHNWPLMGAQRWIGFNNYIRMFHDTRFMSALNFTAYYTVIVTIVIFALAFPLALFVERERAFVSTYRTIIFLPVVVGLASASLLWVWLANVDSGFIGPALKALGLVDRPPNLLATFDSAFLTIIVMVVWKIAGFTMIILLTGLQAIPADLTEAAVVDGASWWQRFRFITLPLMRRTIALALIISVTGSILAFDQFYIMTAGGPQNRMISVVYYIFNQSFVSFNLGYGAALSIALLAILVVISIAQLWLLRVGEERS
jgi:multiple sugar transport system permease protein